MRIFFFGNTPEISGEISKTTHTHTSTQPQQNKKQPTTEKKKNKKQKQQNNQSLFFIRRRWLVKFFKSFLF